MLRDSLVNNNRKGSVMQIETIACSEAGFILFPGYDKDPCSFSRRNAPVGTNDSILPGAKSNQSNKQYFDPSVTAGN